MAERGKVSFSLKKAAPAPAKSAPQPRVAAFEAEEEDARPRGPPGTAAVAPPSKQTRRKHEEAESIDQSVFDYDGVYDKMKRIERDMKQAQKEESKARKPKYMNNFFASAEVRERDRLRAEAKMTQREREAEGDQFADKEAFVTNAYREQQENLARAEEEERVREERERSRSRGVASFYRNMLNEESERRQAAVEALASADAGDAAPEEADEDKSDLDLAREAEKRGLHVALNDDNQIIDRRDLLKSGLNIRKKRKADDEPEREPEARAAPRSDRAARSQLMEEELLAKMMGGDDE